MPYSSSAANIDDQFTNLQNMKVFKITKFDQKHYYTYMRVFPFPVLQFQDALPD